MRRSEIEIIVGEICSSMKAAESSLREEVRRKNKVLISHFTKIVKLDKNKYQASGSCYDKVK